MRPALIVTTGAATHAGKRRTLNQDAHLATAPVFVVADGVGGHEAGERASAAVIDAFSGAVGRSSLEVDDVRKALSQARRSVAELSSADDGRAGSTLSGVVVASVDGVAYWLVINIGDSRTYRLQGDELEQISVDHSVVQELIEAGELTPADAVNDRRRNIITRAIGAGSTGDADYWLVPAELGDRMLICSDGLTAEVPDVRIRAVLAATPDPQTAADALVDEALGAGGRDNVTVVVVDAVAVASRSRVLPESDTDVDADTRPREAAGAGVG